MSNERMVYEVLEARLIAAEARVAQLEGALREMDADLPIAEWLLDHPAVVSKLAVFSRPDW